VDAMIFEGAALTDPVARRQKYEDIQLYAQEEAINIWMYQRLNGVHLQNWITGFYYNPAYQQSAYSWIYAYEKVQP
jgi:ABC-type transport system substrate-binding protein